MYRTDTTIDSPSGGVSSPGRPTATSVQLRPTLLGIASAHPPFQVTMQDSWELLFQHMSPQVRFGKRIIESTAVQKRHIMWDPNTLQEVCTMQLDLGAYRDHADHCGRATFCQHIEGLLRGLFEADGFEGVFDPTTR